MSKNLIKNLHEKIGDFFLFTYTTPFSLSVNSCELAIVPSESFEKPAIIVVKANSLGQYSNIQNYFSYIFYQVIKSKKISLNPKPIWIEHFNTNKDSIFNKVEYELISMPAENATIVTTAHSPKRISLN